MLRVYSFFLTVLSVIGCIGGILAFIYFMFVVHNLNASVWGLISGIFAALSFHLSALSFSRKLYDWYTTKELTGIIAFGLITFLLLDVALAVYLYLAITKQQSYTLKDFSYYPAATCVGVTIFWSLNLFISGLLNKRQMLLYPVLLSNDVRLYS